MKKYTEEEAKKSSIDYFEGDELAGTTWLKKYALRNSNGEILELNPDMMHRRLAKEFARIEANYPNGLSEDEIYETFKGFKRIIPQGSPMYGIGNEHSPTSLSNCFVIGNDYDSYGSIALVDQQIIQLSKRRGGVGTDLSHIRPKGSIVKNAASTSTGIVPFMERYSNTLREVGQDGRRAAGMLSISVRHPESENFVDAKLEQTKVTGANISVKIKDDFMEAVINNKPFKHQYPVDSLNPLVVVEKSASKLWKKIIYNAWKSAEPGVIFEDTILRESPADCYKDFGFKTVSTNPCGEIPLSPLDSCRLLLLNLYSYVVNPFTDECYFDFELFRKDARIAQRFMDDLIDLELEKLDVIINKIISDPEPDEIKIVELNLWRGIKESAIKGRRTGLGITGEGDMLAAMGLRYGTDEATDFAVSVQKSLAIESYKSSIELAKERGAFPVWNYELEKENPFINRLINSEYDGIGIDIEEYKKHGRRNIANLTIPPAGTTSLMTSTTSGIEPVFLATYKRRRKTEDKSKSTFVDEIGDMWEEFNVFHKQFITWYEIYCKKNNLECKSIQSISDDELKWFYERSPYYLATANDVDWVKKVEMQGRLQLLVDHSISVTINLNKDVSVDLVNDIYITAFKSGCKGVTVYRDGCRSGVLVGKDDKKEGNDGIVYHDAPKRSKVLNCDIHTKTIKGQPWTVIIGLDKDRPYEVFAYEQLPNHDFPVDITKGTLTRVGKQHYMLKATKGEKEYRVDNIISLLSSEEQSQTRSFSRELRHGIHPKFIISDIDKDALITSFKRVIARTLKLYIQDNEKGGTCPECGGTLKYEGGCNSCIDCGYGKCG